MNEPYTPPSQTEDEPSLSWLASATSRRLSDGKVALITAVGIAGSTLIPLYALPLWRVGVACVVMAAFGAWAICHRSVIKPRWLRTLARRLTATIGVLAAFVLLFLSMEFVLVNIRQ